MSNKKMWKGRAHDATADAAFERALMGDEGSGRRSFDPREDRKTLQLCEQVRRSLMLGLGGECHDELLSDVYVESVEPMGNSSQLLVRVVVPATAVFTPWQILARLNDRSAKLRAMVAGAISRKRVPGLSFIVVPETTGSPEGGAP